MEETQALASEWLSSLGGRVTKLGDKATIVGLSGDLGSGKTSFVQGVANALGITDNVTSPTFILERIYKIVSSANFQFPISNFQKLIHIDAYRLDNASELKHLGFEELVQDPGNLILIEWPERVQEALPPDIQTLKFEFIDESTRRISF